MALTLDLALQDARYIPTENIFRAPFGAPVVGKYSFGMQGAYDAITLLNVNQVVIDLEPNSWYLIERAFVGGNIGADEYFNSIDPASTTYLPRFEIKKKLAGSIVNVKAVPIVQFFQNRESPVWINSQKKTDQLLMSLTGILVQIPTTLGTAEIQITVGLSIYQMSDAQHNLIMQGMKV
jgi:hypothetical protein